MLDPFSALSLASSIVQFVDFGSKVISSAAELHHSSEGALANNLELSTIVSDLNSISNNLAARHSQQEIQTYSKDEQALIGLASQCKELSDKLLHDLDDLRIKGSHKIWASARQAIRSLWKEAYIAKTSKRLDEFRNELTLRFLALLNDRHSGLNAALTELQCCQDRFETNTARNLLGLKNDLLTLSQDIHKHQQTNDVVWNQVSKTIEHGGTLATQRAILETLKYKRMSERRSNIVEAHIGTFDWIFDPHKTRFLHWLREGDGIYWINGKAGSGKSTLMKYLVGHDIVKRALVDWAGTKALFTGNYFFWSAGNEMEKSQKGLLQSLLYDILRSRPSQLPALFPDRWMSPNDAGANMDGSWSQNELLDAFELLTKKQAWPAKFFLFIDGVDEFMGDPTEITRLLKAFATSVDVKVLVSSRPWTEIETSLNPIPDQILTLHEFTQNDVKSYIYDLMAEHPGFRDIKMDKRYSNLIDKISKKAQGVFLWVVFAVREMFKGLTHEDTISELESRLRDVPPELEELFERILNSIEKIYRPQTSQILQMCLATSKSLTPLPLLTFSFLDGEQDNPNYADLGDITPWTNDHMVKELKTLKRRVKARCRDFLQIVPADMSRCFSSDRGFTEPYVEFLHRTVRDFFLQHGMQTLLRDWIKYPYNPHLSLCRSFAMQVKVLPVMHPSYNTETWLTKAINRSLYHAARAETSCGPMVSALIEEIDRMVVCRSCRYKNYDSEERIYYLEPDRFERGWILAEAVQGGVHGYVRQKLRKSPALVNNFYGRFKLLNYVLFAPWQRLPRFRCPHNFEDNHDCILMLRILLEAGADPNHILRLDERFLALEEVTVWSQFLVRYFEPKKRLCSACRESPVLSRFRAEALKLLLNYGADPSAAVLYREPGNKSPQRVSEYLKKSLPNSAECYNTFLEYKKKNKLRYFWSMMLKWKFDPPQVLLIWISGAETEILIAFVLNMIIIGLEILQEILDRK
ncbi:hypothetical protein NHQ30_000432 [Ciborinia camelliae]|nr:hypothetical protein NHQ30_000432 [Ciborinia camelliae]